LRTEISTSTAAQPGGTYSQGIVAGGFLFVSGQGPFDAAGAQVEGSFEDQATAVLANIQAIAQAAGTDLRNAVKIGAYLRDLDDFPAWDAVCAQTFTRPFPTRTTVESALVGFDVEVDAIIWLGTAGAESSTV
jgi:2-iminobutanoate/2-iminopropanoate deaminase